MHDAKKISVPMTEIRKEHNLVKSLGLRDVTSFGVSATLGSGILVSVGYMAKFYTGPSVTICFGMVVLVVLLSVLCFAEFASKVHTTGIGYAYTTHVFGEAYGFCIGVITFVSYCFGTAAGARGFSQYLSCFIYAVSGIDIPDWLVGRPIPGTPLSGSVIAPALCLVATLVSILGAKNSAFVSNILVIMNLSLMIVFTIYGTLQYGDFALLDSPTIPSIGWRGIFDACGSAFFCLIGWELTCSLSEEVKRPARDLPTGILSTLAIVGSIYCAVAFTLSVMVPYDLINVGAPVAYAFLFHGDTNMYLLVSFVATTVCVSNVLSSSIGTPRVVYAIARDGHLFKSLATLSSTTHVPLRAALVCGAINMIGSGLFDFESLAKLTSCMTLIIYASVSFGILFLRLDGSSQNKIFSSRRPLLIFSICIFIITSLIFQFNLLSSSTTDSIVWGIINFISFLFVIIVFLQAKKRSVSNLEQSLLTPSPQLVSPGTPVPSSPKEVFNCPLVPVVPLLAVWTNLFMIATMGTHVLIVALTITFISAIVYYIQ